MSSRDLQLDMAVTHLICPVCAGETESQILIDQRLKTSQQGTPLHDKLHGRATGISKDMCAKCREELNAADPTGVYLVEFDPARTNADDMKEGNVWRTGRVIAVKAEAFRRWFNTDPPAGQWGYTEYPIVKEIQGS